MLQAGVAQDAVIDAPIANAQAGVMLPAWNRNQGNIRAARARLVAAEADVERARLQQRERLATAYQRVANMRRQLETLDQNVIPDATKAIEQVRQIYEARGERFFETLDARRTLAQSRIDRLNALGEWHTARAELDAITQLTPLPE